MFSGPEQACHRVYRSQAQVIKDRADRYSEKSDNLKDELPKRPKSIYNGEAAGPVWGQHGYDPRQLRHHSHYSMEDDLVGKSDGIDNPIFLTSGQRPVGSDYGASATTGFSFISTAKSKFSTLNCLNRKQRAHRRRVKQATGLFNRLQNQLLPGRTSTETTIIRPIKCRRFLGFGARLGSV
ncbi:unnamed protein product [Protopolystoma xenopodis]|uniref:Uncharacterized protein n=1 Tax=Protopolystoma xenopodis TaxID=117903 RepID=A0A3S5BTX5_9PLAT|nr:unnamed protein product [Protopolystoma xenopodis]